MKRLVVAATLLSCAVGVASARAADSCTLVQAASLSLDPLPSPYRGYTVPVKISGVDQKMLLRLSEPTTSILASYADGLKLPSRKLPDRVEVREEGERAMQEVEVPSLQIGPIPGSDLWVLKIPQSQFPGGAVGVLGTDLLSQFDMELDFAHGKLNLFSPNHCSGAGVYWAKSYAAIPFGADAVGHLSVKMELDGQRLTVGFLPDAPFAWMDLPTAKKFFDLAPESPGITPATDVAGVKAYRYPFKALAVGGVRIGNPQIYIVDDGSSGSCDGRLHIVHNRMMRCYGRAQLELGMAELRQLRLYFSFRNKMLYVTSADPHTWSEVTHFPVSLHCADPDADEYFTADGPDGSITARVNFAINSSGPPGAIKVTPGKDGVCIIRADKGTSIMAATVGIPHEYPSGGASSEELLKHVEITEQGSGEGEARLYILRVRASDATAGTLTLDLPLRYH